MRIIIEKGDTLWDLTKLLCGDPTRWVELAEFNKIQDPDMIIAGQHLIIPPQLIPAIIESSRVLQGE